MDRYFDRLGTGAPALRGRRVIPRLSAVILGVLTIAVLAGCRRRPPAPPQQRPVAKPPGTTNAVSESVRVFSGRVVSTLGKAVASAEVEIGGQRTRTGPDGFFRIVVGEEDAAGPGRFVLNIRKEGFGLVSKIHGSGCDNGSWTMTPATTQSFDPTRNVVIQDIRPAGVCKGTLSSRADWATYPTRRIPHYIDAEGNVSDAVPEEVRRALEFAENCDTCNPGISISIPANSLVGPNGAPPAGQLTASVSTVDIYDPDSMPGDYSVRTDDGASYMVTYGAGAVTVTGAGDAYQLRKGARARLTIPVSALQFKQGGRLEPTIPLLSYNEKLGMWEVEGEARLNDRGNGYVAEVAHLSAFNMDLVKTDQACVRIDSSGINGDYLLEVTIPYDNNTVVRTVEADNTPETLHAIYNLPSNTAIALRGFRQVGMGVIPITDTVSVSTGAPQNPQTPNRPDYPYGACNAQVTLTQSPLVPVLYLAAPPTATGTFTLVWDYNWVGFTSSQQGYQLEESTESSASGFSVKYTTAGTGQPDTRTHVEYELTRPPDTYWYRVRAKTASGPTPYSNVVKVVVDPGAGPTTPTTLRIINDLYDQVETGPTDWYQLNTIITLRVGPTKDSVQTGTGATELLYPHDTTDQADSTLAIPPAWGQDTSYRQFDVSGIPLGADGTYYVFICTGWWEPFFDPTTYEFLYWIKHYTQVLDCSGNCCAQKWTTVHIMKPFGDPEVLRASAGLPQTHWQGSQWCP